jgi:hypothetical protein
LPKQEAEVADFKWRRECKRYVLYNLLYYVFPQLARRIGLLESENVKVQEVGIFLHWIKAL